MDKANPSRQPVQPGISIRNGPLEEMDLDEPRTNGVTSNGNLNGKRKARQSLDHVKKYKEASSDEDDDEPLVRV